MTGNKEIFPHPLSVHNYILRIRGSVGMYMESGLLDLLNIAPLNEDTYKPADLYYDDTLSAYWTGPTALMGEIRVSRNSVTYNPRDEGKSLASGCDTDDLVNQIAMLDILFTGDLEIATSSSDVFCPETIKLLNKKRAQSFFPASAFNAKMRMFIQSVYGSKRDYEMDNELGNLGGLRIDGTQLNPYFDGYILYTGPDYNYFALNVRSTIRVTKLELSSQGEKLRQWLLDNPQSETEQRRYEAYLLSTATFGDFVTVGSESTTGATFGYTWHANWNGTEAHKVTYKVKSGTTNVWEFRHYKLAISWHGTSSVSGWDDSSDWTFALTEEEGPTEATFQVGGDLIWSPDWAAGGMELFVSQDTAHDGPTHIDSDVPVYVVYNYSSDDFDIVRFERTFLGSGDTFDRNIETAESVHGHMGKCEDHACELWASAGSTTEKGFSIEGNSDFTSVSKAVGSVNFDSDEIFRGGEAYNRISSGNAQSSELCESLPPSADHGDRWEVTARGGHIKGGGGFGHENMLVVPFYDCDAVYIGTTDSFDGDISTARTVGDGHAYGGQIWFDSDDNNVTGETPLRVGMNWNNTGAFSYPEANNLYWHSKQAGQINEIINAETTFQAVVIQFFANGEFSEAHSSFRVSNADVAPALYIPGCFNLSIIPDPLNNPPSWEHGSVDYGGYEFNPVVFPIAENMLPVIARSSLTGNYRATQNPGEDTFIDDGEYNYGNYSQYLSYVGHD